MSSIPHAATPHDTQGTSRNSHAHQQEAFTPPPALVEQFYAEAKRQIVTGDYLRRKWLPIAGPKCYVLIKALRAHCSYAIKDGEAMCYPSETTLAQECGVARRTLLYWLQRSPEGRFARKVVLPDGGTRWEDWDWSALNAFLRIVPKRRYDPAGQRSLKAANRYFIRMDDPPVPEDEPLIWDKARELAGQFLKRQAEEEKHEARREDCEAKASRAPSFDTADCTLNNAQKLHTQQCAISAHNRLSLTLLSNTDTHRTISERQPSADMSVRRGGKKTLARGEPDVAQHGQQTIREKLEKAGPAPQASEQASEGQPTPFAQALAEAAHIAGDHFVELLQRCGDATPIRGMKTILIVLVHAGAPTEKLHDLAVLGWNRLCRWRERGGQIWATEPGYLISIMQHLANEARDKAWDTGLIELEDQLTHERMMRGRAAHKTGTRSARRPAPAEAEQAAPTEAGHGASTEASAKPEALGAEEESIPEVTTTSEPEDAPCPAQDDPAEAAQRYARRPVDPRAKQIWQSALERIRAKVSQSAYTTWFSGTSGLALEDEMLVVRVGSTFSQQHLEQRFSDLIESAVSEQRGTRTETRLIVIPDPQEED